MDKLRKYGSLLMLMMMSVSFVCLVLDAYCETSDAITQCQSSSDSLMVDDIDFDQSDCSLLSLKKHSMVFNSVRVNAVDMIAANYSVAKISDDLKLGLVRRYDPREDGFSGVDCTRMFPITIENNGLAFKSLAVVFFVI